MSSMESVIKADNERQVAEKTAIAKQSLQAAKRTLRFNSRKVWNKPPSSKPKARKPHYSRRRRQSHKTTQRRINYLLQKQRRYFQTTRNRNDFASEQHQNHHAQRKSHFADTKRARKTLQRHSDPPVSPPKSKKILLGFQPLFRHEK